MPIYLGTTKIYNPPFGTTSVDKIFVGTEPAFARMILNFDEQGGSAVSNKMVYYGDQYGTLQSSSKSYYTFGGWSKTIGGASVYSSTIVDEIDDFTLYAKWNEAPSSPINLTYNSNTQTSITYTLENPNPYSVRVYYEVSDSTPDANYTTVAANDEVQITVTGLSAGTGYTTYVRFYSTQSGVYSGTVSAYNTTQSAGGTNWVLTGTSINSPTAYSYNGSVTKNGSGSCWTTTAMDTSLTSSHPPRNYSVGYVMRVTHYHDRINGNLCGYYWFTNN